MRGRPFHPLEAWTRRAFSEDFARLVLHGLLSEAKTDKGRITIEGVDQTGRKRRQTFSVTKPRPEGWDLKPLVLAALLKQLVGQRVIEFTLNYTFKALLADLMWPDIPAMRRVVKDAIEFYYSCSYSTGVEYNDGANRHRMQVNHRLITLLDFGGIDTPQCDQFSDEGNTVSFDSKFVEALRRGEVVFAGTDFGEFSGGRASPGGRREHDPGGAADTVAPHPQWLFRPPGPRPVLLFEATPVSLRPGDGRSKMAARAFGETTISFDTGAIASAVLRALNRVAARHSAPHPCPSVSAEAIAENVHREIDRLVRGTAYSVVRQVRRRVFEDALSNGYGLMHSMLPSGSYGRRGAKPAWYSQDHFVSSLMRAVEAIEFGGWRPRQRAVVVNSRWGVQNVNTATISLVAAYWAEAEGKELGRIDSGRMTKWLKSLGLPSFSKVRSLLRPKIAEKRRDEVMWQRYGGNVWAFLAFGGLSEGL